MRLSSHFIIAVLVAVLGVQRATAQEKSGGKVHGCLFGDYFYKIAGDSTGNGSQYSSLKKDEQAFQFRRFYLYYDHIFNETFSAQFLLEGNDKALEPGGRHGVFVKTAYLEWKDIIPMGNLMIGLVPTPTWSSPGSVAEKIWNYRSIEKTIADFRCLGSASDIGVSLRGNFDGEGKFNYVAMIGNGTGQKPENNKYKKYYAGLRAKPVNEFVIEGYVDFEPAAGDKDKTTLKGFAAYQTETFTAGVEVVTQTQKKAGAAGADRSPFGLSFFAWAPIPGVDNLNAFARYDFFNPDTKVPKAGFNESFITAGLDYMPIKNVHFMPNVWVNTFSDKSPAGVSRDADVVARLTFFFVYK